MKISEIRQLLESPYTQKEWKVFLQSHFTNGKLFGDAHSIELTDKTISKKCFSLGNYEVNEYTKIGIFEVQLNDNVKLTRNRVGLRNLIKSITQQVAGAMVVFVQGDQWRFSYISKRKVKNAATDTIEDKETAPKRYTYLFGKGEKALTAAQRFDKLIQKQQGNIFQFLTLNDFEEAFSVEKLSKDFFNEYKKSYEDFVEFITGKRYLKKGNKFVETIIHPANFQLRNLFGNDEKQARDFCKRMMGRIVFLYFIQKKGWLAVAQGKKWGEGNPDYLFDLYRTSKHKDDFYTQELVPLFFKTLNNTNSEKETNTLRFPYLNGGLFDDSHDRKFNKLAMPTEIFEKLFNTFNNFNFTIYEDAPDEHTVAVDPEMLGHIFENLLEDNKDKGAFYTPKEIVHYMCRESLKEYLCNYDLGNATEDLKKRSIIKILLQEELEKDETRFIEKHAIDIIGALKKVKICDPAIGSGAFPMGLLQEIFNAQIYLMGKEGFTRKDTEAKIKKHIIEESIYGVDIDAGAVDIARLRFWLSLVVDETEPQPLPNLSFKIVCANTLIPLGKIKNLDMGGTKEIADELAQVRHDYFNANMNEKLELEINFTSLQKKLLTTAKDWVSKEDANVYQRLLEFSPFEETSCTWFDAWWMFGVNDGFDIVIGNPPYVQLQKDGGKLANLFKNCSYKSYERTGDIYTLFYEKGIGLLKPKGYLCFITSNKWMKADYGESLRNLLSGFNPILLIDLGPDVFENATVDSNILIIQKEENQNQSFACIATGKDIDLHLQLKKNGLKTQFNTKKSWIILNPIEQSIREKIERLGKPLKDWDIRINYGIKTGYNEAFIIDGLKKDELIKADPKSAEIIRPILRGRDIKQYGYDFGDLWLINTHNGIKEKNIPPVMINDYPAIKKHLDSFYSELDSRVDKGITPYNLRNCAYMDDFYKQKIVWIELVDKGRFAFDDKDNFLTLNGTFILTGRDLEYLCCVLNNPITSWHFNTFCISSGVGTNQWRELYVKELHIPNITKKQQNPLIDLFQKIITLKELENSSDKIQKELKFMVYNLFQLNSEEVDFIEAQ